MLKQIPKSSVAVIPGCERLETVFGRGQEQYISLRAIVGEMPERAVVSRWSPTPEQRKAILQGKDIFLSQLTFGASLQPVMLMVCDPDNEPEDAALLMVMLSAGDKEKK